PSARQGASSPSSKRSATPSRWRRWLLDRTVFSLQGLSAKAQTLRRLSPDRRTATLLAALWQLELDATDDALILLDQVVDLLLSQATREHKDRR
ncbi:MAG: hypothetical protein LC790_14780, partial [Actinobacteria bacterium]|nr:hypothetical protein [Actinomycetota bacterium]